MSYRLQSTAGGAGSSIIYGAKRTKATLKTLVGGTGISITDADGVLTFAAGAAADPDLDLGASGTAGSLDIFPTTAAKGKLRFVATDQTGDTTVTITAAAMAQATALTIQDPGGAAANLVTSTGIGAVLSARCTATISATSGTTGTTLTDVTGLTVNVLAAGVYAFSADLATVSTANSGLKLAIGGTATATSFTATGKQWNAGTIGANTTTTTKGNAIAAATAVTTDASIKGTIVVNAAGTLTVQFAQNASHADTTSVLINSNFVVTRIA